MACTRAERVGRRTNRGAVALIHDRVDIHSVRVDSFILISAFCNGPLCLVVGRRHILP